MITPGIIWTPKSTPFIPPSNNEFITLSNNVLFIDSLFVLVNCFKSTASLSILNPFVNLSIILTLTTLPKIAPTFPTTAANTEWLISIPIIVVVTIKPIPKEVPKFVIAGNSLFLK